MGRLELVHTSPESARQVPDFGPQELAWGHHFGLTANRARLAILTERGLAEYKELAGRC